LNNSKWGMQNWVVSLKRVDKIIKKGEQKGKGYESASAGRGILSECRV
jgi:hypothetical protein